MIFSVKSTLMSWVMRKRMRQIELFMIYPNDIQSKWIDRLVLNAKDTLWGRKFGYKDIRSYQSFCERVPISKYEDIVSYIDMMRAGEDNVLWPNKNKWFAKSSGTSGQKSKYIPITEESLIDCHFKGGKDMLSLYCNNYPDTKIFNGKSVIMGGSHEPSLSSHTKEGDLSAIIVENLPLWVNIHQTPNKTIRLMNDFEQKIKKMSKITSNENVTNISGVPSWVLVLFNKILEEKKCTNMHEVWPNLELYMHGGISFSPYKEQFKMMLPQKMNYLETYNASEGFFGIQDQKNSDEMLLMLDYGIFYEFIPMQQFKEQKAVPLWEVEKGVNYAMVITTNAGLWRYVIGDTVTFTSIYPYRIKITGRTSQFINVFGEELMADNVLKGLEKSCNITNSIVNEFTVAPIFMSEKNKGAHEWIIEFNKKPENIELFINELDNALKELNSDYEAKRKNDLALKKPLVHVVEKGTFYRWMKTKNKLGRQFKVPRLSNNRSNLESILKLENLSLKSYNFL